MNEDDFNEVVRIQRMMAERIVEERRIDHKVDILNLIQQLLEGKKRVAIEALILEAHNQGLQEGEVTRLLDELVNDHLIKTQEGFITQD